MRFGAHGRAAFLQADEMISSRCTQMNIVGLLQSDMHLVGEVALDAPVAAEIAA